MTKDEQALEIMRAFRQIANALEADGIAAPAVGGALLACAVNWYVDRCDGVDAAPGWLRAAAMSADQVAAALRRQPGGTVQ